MKRYILSVTYNNEDYDEFKYDDLEEAKKQARLEIMGMGDEVEEVELYDLINEEYINVYE